MELGRGYRRAGDWGRAGYPLAYSIGTGLVLGSIFGGLMLWLQRRAESRLKAEGLDPGDLEPMQEVPDADDTHCDAEWDGCAKKQLGR